MGRFLANPLTIEGKFHIIDQSKAMRKRSIPGCGLQRGDGCCKSLTETEEGGFQALSLKSVGGGGSRRYRVLSADESVRIQVVPRTNRSP